MAKVLLDSDKHGWGRGQDNQRLPGPFGRPQDHTWEGREPGQSQKSVVKPLPMSQEPRFIKIHKFRMIIKLAFLQFG